MAATSHQHSLIPVILPASVDWSDVRPIYKKLSDEFEVLLQPYGIQIDELTRIHLDHLIIAIDCVDHVLDEIPVREDRTQLSDDMIAFLQGKDDLLNNPDSTNELNRKLAHLRTVIKARGVESAFLDAARRIFQFTEEKRHTADLGQFLIKVQEEGRATASLTLSIIGDAATDQFKLVFTKLCSVMGVADLVFDISDDFKKKQILIRPRFHVYFKLIKITIISGIDILGSVPAKISFIRYCIRFGWSLIRGG